MLKLKYLFENYDLAKSILKNWEYDTDRLDEMLSYFRISSNALYPFFCNGKIQMLRFAPIDEKLSENVYGEHEFIEYLRSNDYPAMKPVAARNGKYVLEISNEWGNYFATVFERVDGVQIEETDYNDKVMYKYGEALGRLHKLSSCYEPKVKKWTHEDVIDWIESELSKYNNTGKALIEASQLRLELGNLQQTKQNYGLVHYDYEQDNVFYCEQTNSCSVIDFDDGMYHWFALDIEQCFDSLAEEIEDEKLENAKNKFVEGYKTQYDLTDEMLETFPLMRRFINLYSYTRIVRSMDDKIENEPDWMIGLRQRLNGMITEIVKTFN